jgi:hypothetical protein
MHEIAPFCSSQWSCTDEMVIKRAVKMLNFTGNRIDNRKMIGVALVEAALAMVVQVLEKSLEQVEGLAKGVVLVLK